MGIKLKLLDNVEYDFKRESPYGADDREMRTLLHFLEGAKGGYEIMDAQARIEKRLKTIARVNALFDIADRNLSRSDIDEGERAKWIGEISKYNDVLQSEETSLEEIQLRMVELMKKTYEASFTIARWALTKQHGKTELEADLLLNPELAGAVCNALMGVREEERGDEQSSPLSESPAKSDSG